MKPKFNPYKYKQLDALKRHIEKQYPSLLVGFFIKDFPSSSMATTPLAVSATFEVYDDGLARRVYRKSDTPDSNVWDVDQINAINKQVKLVPKKSETLGHHISHTIEKDIMKRNHMLFEVVENEHGDFILNTDDNGLVKCFINFEEPPNREG